MNSGSTVTQLFRYGLVGIASSGVLYLAYLELTTSGLGAKLAMSILYALGVAQTFFFNKRWSFGHEGGHGPAFFRYCASYGIGYVVNLTALLLLVDTLGFPHKIVQGVMILTIAAMLFLLQKFWVFRQPPPTPFQEPTP
jgi:putative flippase GtrA